MLHKRQQRHIILDAEALPASSQAPPPEEPAPPPLPQKKTVKNFPQDSKKPHLLLGKATVVKVDEDLLEMVQEANKKFADTLGIDLMPKKVNCVKPIGKPYGLSDTTSGIHPLIKTQEANEFLGLSKDDQIKALFDKDFVQKALQADMFGDASPPEETPNQAAAVLLGTKVDSLSGSPWIHRHPATGEETNFLAQLLWSLQNPDLDMQGKGFVITLDQSGKRLTFYRATPRNEIGMPYDKLYSDDARKNHLGRPIVDVTYWNVVPNWPHGTRGVTIPVCRVSGFRGSPILGTTYKSVRRALITMGPYCPCHCKNHYPARGDDARDVQGIDRVSHYENAWIMSDQPAAPLVDNGEPKPPVVFKPIEPVDPFPPGC